MAANVVINGVVYNAVPEVNIPISGGGTAKFYDSSDATATSDKILSGFDAYIVGGKANGGMPENGTLSGVIQTVAGAFVIPAGHTTGGTVQIDPIQQALIISANIKANTTILGVPGKSTVVDTEISTGAANAGVIVNGYKAYVNGVLIDGQATMPVVSQNSTTKVLSIS